MTALTARLQTWRRTGQEKNEPWPKRCQVLHLRLVGRAAERPPLTSLRQRPLIRGLAVAALGAALEAGVSVALGQWGLEAVAIAAALGIMIAVLAGVFAGPLVGLAVAATGWALHFALVSGESWADAAALPAWLVAGASAGWVGRRLQARSAERELLDEALSALRGAAQDAVIGVDGEGTIVAWDDGAAALYGYTSDEALGRHLADLTAPGEAGDETRRFLEALGRGERASETDVSHRRAAGDTAFVRLTGMPIRKDDLRGSPAVVVASDVTRFVSVRVESEEAEARYHSLVEQLPGATYVHPLGGRNTFTYVSPQVGTMLGFRSQDWFAEPGVFFRLVHEDDQERVGEEIQRATEAATPLNSEYRMLGRNGSIIWVRDQAATVRGSDGEPLYVQGYLQDVTAEHEMQSERDRLRAEARTATSEAAYRQKRLDLLARASVALAASLEQGAALRRAADLVVDGFADWCLVDLVDEKGSASRAVVARGATDPAAGTPPSQPESSVIEVIETGEAVLTKDRVCVPMVGRSRTLGAVTLLAGEGGRAYEADDLAFAEHFARLVALTVDNARLHQQVQEGADAAHVLTYVADGVFLVDRAGVIRLWNPTVEAITGLEASNVVGQQAADVIPDWQSLADRIPVGGAEPVQPETVPIETDFGERWISISGVEFFDGTVYALRDLTEVRRLEELKAEFVATASHELRTPLAAVYGAAQTLRRHDFALDEAGRERFVSLIVDESERLGRIVNDILLANQLDIGRVELRTEVFDPAELVERVVEGARIHAPPTIALIAAAHPPLSPIASDRDRVRQVLTNLLENAMKYSPQGGRIEVGVSANGQMVRFYVRDEGLGIPSQEQTRIFDKFYRLDPQMTGGVGGTGLGLYICNELVQRMGGRIWVESDEESGSIFLFEIPANESAPTRSLVHDVLDASGG
jgi:two-component system, OmpR family, phosphate regulon sensor histidine kinase PhoR